MAKIHFDAKKKPLLPSFFPPGKFTIDFQFSTSTSTTPQKKMKMAKTIDEPVANRDTNTNTDAT